MRADTPGRFIAVDGIDGCGKSTQVRLLARELEARGASVLTTREPGGTDVGTRLREILLSSATPVEPVTELLLYGADRLEHLSKLVIPALAAGDTVVSDRFAASTFAYQVRGRGLPEDVYDTLKAHTVITRPDIVVIIDIAPDVAVERAIRRLSRDGALDDEGKFEKLGIDFFERVRNGFLEYADANANTVIVDGSMSIEEISGVILQRVIEVMP